MSIDRRSVLKSTAAAAVVGGPFAGLVAAPAEARRPPNAANLVPIPDLRDGAGAAAPAPGLPVPLVPRHRVHGGARRRHRAARPARRHGRLPGPERQRPAGPQPRGHQQPGQPVGVRARHAVRRGRGRRDDDHRGHEVRRGGARLHQPQRHDVQLQRRDHAVGVVDHLRGDGQRARRRARLHRHRPTPTLQQPHGYVFEVPKDGQSDRQPITRAGRFPHEAVSFDPQRRHPLPHRGQLRVPLRLLPLRPAAQPDEDRLGSRTRDSCRCWPSGASRTPTSRPGSRSGRPTASPGSTSTIRTRRSRTRPAAGHATTRRW